MSTPRTDRPRRASRCLLILTAVLAGLCLPTLTPGGGERVTGATPQALTFEQRVLHQRHIEEVYWRHRIWPTENPGPKPSLDAVLVDAQIRARVEDYLKKSNALEVLWGRPRTA